MSGDPASDLPPSRASRFGVYGQPLAEATLPPADALQLSPLAPGAAALEAQAPASFWAFAVAAPPGTLERRYVLALCLRALQPGGVLTASAPKTRGGARLGKELEAFGCDVEETGRRHQRVCRVLRPGAPTGLDAAIAAGGPQWVAALEGWSQPGVFSWNRPDPGSLLLARSLPALSGRGADLGCGAGALARAVLQHSEATALDLIDLDRRAIEAARRNVEDGRARFHWADARAAPLPDDLDFVVMNPPFHDGGAEDRALGQAFIRRAHQLLKRGGAAWLVANRHLPYEAVLSEVFASVTLRAEDRGFKVFEARR